VRSWFGRLEDAQQHLADVHRLHLSTIEAFSTAIEAKDGVTSDHIHRVQAYAMGLARVLGVTDAETLKALEAAALLHDTGKLAIPEHILNKPGKLTAQEFETMKAHVDIGADILSTIDFPFPVVPIVRAHHEHWNGTGYPRGLSGHDIPIGARILSVVDCFDALTSDRPYRPALAESAALEIIQKGRGTQYDPEVVDAFARSYRELAPTSLPQPRLEALLASMRSTAAAPAAGLAPSPVPVPAGPAAPTSELLAFVSLARLASGTPTLADVGALADGHLRQLAPGATIALFGLDASGTAVTAHFTAGPAAECVNGVSMRLGERLTGWVAANMRSMANADPRLDLGAGTPSGLRHATATPLVVDGELTGALTVYGAEPLTDDQSRTLDMIAPQLAVAVAAIQRGAAQAPALRPAMRVVAGGRSR
jgi:putative nucleotidyltransferase with HDIG domain